METIIHSPSELGHLASQTRSELGLRQADVHAHTKLATRFIGKDECIYLNLHYFIELSTIKYDTIRTR